MAILDNVHCQASLQNMKSFSVPFYSHDGELSNIQEKLNNRIPLLKKSLCLFDHCKVLFSIDRARENVL